MGRPTPIEHEAGRAPSVDGLAASLSRTDGVAMVAAGRCRALGIDVERLGPSDDLHQIASRIDRDPPTDPDEVIALWTRKEAIAKAMGVGLPDDVRTLAVPGRAPDVGRWWRRQGWLWIGCPCEAGFAVSLVVASDGPDAQGGFDFIEPQLDEAGIRTWSLLLPV